MTSDPNSVDVLVGQNIHNIRLLRGLNVAVIADLLGADERAVEEKEAGLQRFSAEELLRLCAPLKIAPAEIYAPRLDP